ncbi:hypothetical protein C8R45DRAFT_1041808 [Mycena sanguinolenta]|nr:hypothetical protein C8R45DRAFT_1041808 [Mycena sanguinolenta]
MVATLFSMCAILTQQIERTSGFTPTEIKQLIAESDSRVTSLHNEIMALESQIAALMERRDFEFATGDALRSLVAPIRVLPAELLAEIFLLTIRDNSVHVQDAFRVSHVCRHWRQIATGLARLWTGPVLVPFFRKSDEAYVQGLHAWLTHSAPLAVPIVLQTPININESEEIEFGSPLVGELLHVAHRMRSLRFISKTSSWIVQRLAGATWDALEELELGPVGSNDNPDVDFDGSIILSFTNAPRLRKLTIDLSSRMSMPWAQLTDITMLSTISTPEVFRDIVSQWKNVTRIDISVRDWSVRSPPQTAVLALDHLRVLAVRWFGHVVDEMAVLDSLSVPTLDDLSLNFHFHTSIEWAEAKLTAFQRRSPNITKLEIKSTFSDNIFTLPSGALIAALRNAPGLSHLSIDGCPDLIDNDFLSALCYADDHPLVPCLRSLILAEIHETLSQDGLADMIASRWWTDTELASRSRVPTVARWRQIRLKDRSSYYPGGFKLSQKFRETMEKLRQTGLAVDLVDYDIWDGK